MRRKIDFTLTLIPLASGGWNFDLQAVGSGITPGYYSRWPAILTRNARSPMRGGSQRRSRGNPEPVSGTSGSRGVKDDRTL